MSNYTGIPKWSQMTIEGNSSKPYVRVWLIGGNDGKHYSYLYSNTGNKPSLYVALAARDHDITIGNGHTPLKLEYVTH